MRKRALFLTVISAGVLLASPAFGQMCGDVNGDQLVDIGDMVYILHYTIDNGPPPVVLGDAELDHRDGITFSDAVAIADYMFWKAVPPPYICGVTGTYSFAPAPNDTIFLPRMLGIRDGMDTVQLPIAASFEADTRGYYLPLLATGAGSNDVFTLDTITSGWMYGNAGLRIPDTSVLNGIDIYGNQLVGKHNLHMLNYVRVNPGVGDIVTELADRNSLWRYAIEKDGDLVRPVVVYEDFYPPPETLLVSLTDLSFTAVAGKPSRDSFTVEFTSSSTPISFDLAVSDPWIVIEGLTPEGLVTPATVVVTADATQVGIGNYVGQISIIDLDPPAPTTADAIDIDLTVKEPGVYPAGDANCDGIVDIGDVTVLINYLYLGGDPPVPCE